MAFAVIVCKSNKNFKKMTDNLLKNEAVVATASVKKLSPKQIQMIHETTVATVEVGNRVGRTTEFISDYTKFKQIESNRKVSPNPELLEDIGEFGQLSPVIVKSEGDKLLVLNGQHRLFHLKQLGLPVEVLYISENFKGDDFDAVKSLNVRSRNWSGRDYSEHYIKEGNPNFEKFEEAKSKFSHLTPTLIYSQVNGSKGNLTELYKKGSLKFNPTESDIKMMEKLNELIGSVEQSRKDNSQDNKNNYFDRLNVYNALKKFIQDNPDFDYWILKKKLEENGFKIKASVIVSDISELYSEVGVS